MLSPNISMLLYMAKKERKGGREGGRESGRTEEKKERKEKGDYPELAKCNNMITCILIRERQREILITHRR